MFEIELFIWMKMDLASNNLQLLICHKTKANQTKPERSDFPMIDNLSIAVHAFPMHILISLLIDEILRPRYVNWSINFRGLPRKVEMVPISVFRLRPMSLAACFRLSNRDSTWAGVSMRSIRSPAEFALVIIFCRISHSFCLCFFMWIHFLLLDPLLLVVRNLERLSIDMVLMYLTARLQRRHISLTSFFDYVTLCIKKKQ